MGCGTSSPVLEKTIEKATRASSQLVVQSGEAYEVLPEDPPIIPIISVPDNELPINESMRSRPFGVSGIQTTSRSQAGISDLHDLEVSFPSITIPTTPVIAPMPPPPQDYDSVEEEIVSESAAILTVEMEMKNAGDVEAYVQQLRSKAKELGKFGDNCPSAAESAADPRKCDGDTQLPTQEDYKKIRLWLDYLPSFEPIAVFPEYDVLPTLPILTAENLKGNEVLRNPTVEVKKGCFSGEGRQRAHQMHTERFLLSPHRTLKQEASNDQLKEK